MSRRRRSLTLEADFTLAPGQEEVACVDLEEEWGEDSLLSRHPAYTCQDIKFVSGQVGEGGDHMNITLRNTSEQSVTVGGAEVVVVIREAGGEEEESVAKEVKEGEAADKEVQEGVDGEKEEHVKEAEVADVEKSTEKEGEVDDSTEKEELTMSSLKDDEEKKASEEGDDQEEQEEKEPESEAETTEETSDPKALLDKESNGDGEAAAAGETNGKVGEGANSEEAMETEGAGSEGETKTSDGKTGLTPDKIDLAACKTPKKKEESESKDNGTVEEEAKENWDKKDESKKAAPTMSMRFVDETVEASKDESMDVDKSVDSEKNGDAFDEMAKGKEKEDKPASGLKLASFSTMTVKSPVKEAGGKEAAEVAGCGQCAAAIPSLHEAIVWETMQFCNEACLGAYQGCMATCSSCRKEVVAASLGKYCVRFGSDIKQFCSNVCLEDYKKGLKVCSYCQKDISSGEGFLAPIGDKGQFKDFCDAACLKKYQVIHLGQAPDPETLPCNVCKEVRLVEVEVVRAAEVVALCSMACLSAFKFVGSVATAKCGLCSKHYDTTIEKVTIHYEGSSHTFCSKPCQNVFVMQKRRIVPCTYCKVKKYNFDMIEKFPEGQGSSSNLYCSLTCLGMHSNHQAKFPGVFPSSLPVISAVSSLAPSPLLPHQQQVPMQTQTVREVVRETHVLPAEQPAMRNKAAQSKPFMLTKGVSCRPHPCHKETQTDGLSNPTPVPIPVPIYMPAPCKMYNAPFPVPVPIPLPFPVPIFIPTTRRSQRGIEKIIKKILNKIPADPFEAELLALAGDVAGGGDDSDDSESDGGDDRDYEQDVPLPAPPAGDLENEMSGERVLPKPLPTSTPDPLDRQRAMGVYNQGGHMKRERGDVDPDDPEGLKAGVWGHNQNRGRRNNNRGRSRGGVSQSPAVKRFRADQSITQREQQAAIQAIQQQPKERPDANHHLKFTYGVNAWKHWVVGKNAELEKQRAQGKYQKTFETDILKLRADELNFTLCMFVKEVKKPNGDQYAADSIFYLVLGIQEYLFENGRIDNIFTDTYYDPFTSALHEVVKDFKLPVNELGYFVTRIEEEHLWEAKQLGAHSPQVLLNTLVYFNTKYFQLKTVDQHLKLSFSHIMKHWKKTNMVTKPGQQQRTVLLRYYPPPAKGQKPEDRKMYEQHENHENPLRCPVKLYEFYLSKCPESTKNRNDMFYLQPERSCVPDSPVWYSAQLLNRFNMEKMLDRLLMVREVQEHMLADQAS